MCQAAPPHVCPPTLSSQPPRQNRRTHVPLLSSSQLQHPLTVNEPRSTALHSTALQAGGGGSGGGGGGRASAGAWQLLRPLVALGLPGEPWQRPGEVARWTPRRFLAHSFALLNTALVFWNAESNVLRMSSHREACALPAESSSSSAQRQRVGRMVTTTRQQCRIEESDRQVAGVESTTHRRPLPATRRIASAAAAFSQRLSALFGNSRSGAGNSQHR